MKPETLKKLQEIGAFVLANGCNKKGLKQIAEMIRSALFRRLTGPSFADRAARGFPTRGMSR